MMPTNEDYRHWSDPARPIERLECGCQYDAGSDETVVVCDTHRPEARFVGGITRYIIDGRRAVRRFYDWVFPPVEGPPTVDVDGLRERIARIHDTDWELRRELGREPTAREIWERIG